MLMFFSVTCAYVLYLSAVTVSAYMLFILAFAGSWNAALT